MSTGIQESPIRAANRTQIEPENWSGITVFISYNAGPAKRSAKSGFASFNWLTKPDPGRSKDIKDGFCFLAASLCADHPLISTDKSIFGGMPHIQGMRLSVGDILAKLHLYGSVEAVVSRYEPNLTEDQVKAAIAYAQDFLEAACERNSSEVDG
jgi:uncharacterized protein (DUF433 family)